MMKIASVHVNKALFLLWLIPSIALGTFPSDDFDSYSTGDLNTLNGGTGWSAAWSCGVDFDVSTAGTPSPNSGANHIRTPATANDHTCQRAMTENTTNDQVISIFEARSVTGADVFQSRLDKAAAAHTIWQLGATANIKIYDNLTLTNVGTYSADTYVRIEIKVNYTNKTNAMAIDGGSFGTAYAFYNGSTATGSDNYFMGFNPNSNGTITVDTISDSTVTPSSQSVKEDDGWWLVF